MKKTILILVLLLVGWYLWINRKKVSDFIQSSPFPEPEKPLPYFRFFWTPFRSYWELKNPDQWIVEHPFQPIFIRSGDGYRSLSFDELKLAFPSAVESWNLGIIPQSLIQRGGF